MQRLVAYTLGLLLLASAASAGRVHVGGYVRRNGTYVHAYTRSIPSTTTNTHRSPGSSLAHPPSSRAVPGAARDSKGHIERSSAARMSFLRSNGLTHTPTGCQVDHIVPLAKGGADSPSNMQLLCGAALREKERTELR